MRRWPISEGWWASRNRSLPETPSNFDILLKSSAKKGIPEAERRLGNLYNVVKLTLIVWTPRPAFCRDRLPK